MYSATRLIRVKMPIKSLGGRRIKLTLCLNNLASWDGPLVFQPMNSDLVLFLLVHELVFVGSIFSEFVQPA